MKRAPRRRCLRWTLPPLPQPALPRPTPRPTAPPHRASPSLRRRCADKAGNSLVVSGVITFRVVDSARAVLDMERVDQYVHLQAQAVLKRVAAAFPYITYDGSPSLITEAAHLGEALRAQLGAAVAVAGVEVVTFMLSDLAYAAEIAPQMLVRQQAQAVIDARKLIVGGAVAIAVDAVSLLAQMGKPVAPAEESRFLANLVLVICSEKSPVQTQAL